MSSEDAPRILICRLSAIGDAILTLPVACAIRDHFPNAYIGWAVEKKAAPMVRGHSALNAVIELERGWFTSWTRTRKAKRALRQHEFEISIDCQGNTKSSLAGKLSGATQRVGYAGRHGSELSRILNNNRVVTVFNHLTDRSLELLTPLGIHSPRVRWDLPLSVEARRWAQPWRQSIKSDRLAVLNPGGTWESKLWEPDRFAQTASYLRDQYGYRSVVVWGSPTEQATARAIVESSDGAAVLAPPTDLQRLCALIATADLFISGDTGPLHMAVAVDTPTIGLYGATRPGDSGPYGQTAIQCAYESGSRRHRRNADNSAMRAISTEHVFQAINEIEAKRPFYRAA